MSGATPDPRELEALERTAAWRLRLLDADPANAATASAVRLLETLADDLRRGHHAQLWTELQAITHWLSESDAISDYAELAEQYCVRIGISEACADGAEYLRGLLAIAGSLV